MNNATLANKSIIVTGAGRGLGAAVATRLAHEGPRLLLADIDGPAVEGTAAALRHAGYTAAAQQMDVTSWDQCGDLIRHCVDRYGRLDGMATFAGVLHLAKPWEEEDGKSARRLVEVNLMGTYYLGAQALRQMKQQGSGSLVTVSSGAQAGMASGGAYAASKGGIASLCYSWAIDAAAHGVRVNAISPIASTQMSAQTDDYLRRTGQLQTARAFVDPASSAVAVAFLLSDLAHDVNGQVLRVHGEQLQLMSHPAVLMPTMTNESWDVPAMAKALAASFPDGMAPLGMTGVDASFVPLAKVIQVPR